jgi:hypothetical protein
MFSCYYTCLFPKALKAARNNCREDTWMRTESVPQIRIILRGDILIYELEHLLGYVHSVLKEIADL